MASDVKYFEDLLIEYLNKVLRKIDKSSPDDFDDMWLDLFKKTKVLIRKADETYLQDSEAFNQEIIALVAIYNDGALMFPDLVKKALDFTINTKDEAVGKDVDRLIANATDRAAGMNSGNKEREFDLS